MSNLVQRTLSGIVFISAVIAAIVLSEPASNVLFLVFTILAVREYHVLVGSKTWHGAISIAAACCLFMSHASDHGWWQLCFFLLLAVSLVAEVFRMPHEPVKNWGNILVSQFMIVLPFALTSDVLGLAEWSVSRWLLLAVFVCLWSNDTGAYCTGSLIGRHKMIPSVSPGKTWEGLAGGFVFSLIAGFVFSLFVKDLQLWQWLALAFTVSVAGTLGDLMESVLKRSLGVKDSGRFMPGHGGVLDRFDSFLLALPAVYVLLLLIL